MFANYNTGVTVCMRWWITLRCADSSLIVGWTTRNGIWAAKNAKCGDPA